MVFVADEEKHLPNQPRKRANPFMTCLCNPKLRLCGGCLQQVGGETRVQGLAGRVPVGLGPVATGTWPWEQRCTSLS